MGVVEWVKMLWEMEKDWLVTHGARLTCQEVIRIVKG